MDYFNIFNLVFLQALILKAETPVIVESSLVHSIHVQQILDDKGYEAGRREMGKLVIHLPLMRIRLYLIESIAGERKVSGAHWKPSLTLLVSCQPMNAPI